jgi:catechol 2,3-dioxygenase
MIRSSLQHVRLATMNLPAMVGWYARIYGMAPARSPTPIGTQAASRLTAAWSSNDRANPRITILSLSGVTVEPRQSERQHSKRITFECATLDDLLAAYLRLKRLDIEPLLTLHFGASIAFFYEDPDSNSVELRLQNPVPSHQLHRSGTQPLAKYVDPEKMPAARAVGRSIAELQQHGSGVL